VNEESIFAAAFEKAPGAERQTYLEEACGDNAALRQRIEDLLEAAASERGMLDNITAAVEMKNGNAARGSASAPSLALGSLIAGRYRLLELIGEGGMGEVFVAEQIEPVRRKVALKLIKPGFDSRAVLARFEKERQALAIMDHPHIAKIFDGGVTELGRPYFVMEYLKGSPITEYCDSVRMPIRERLQLFRSACDAVQHAHQKGVIHRDLKPSNILVALYDDKPVVKVIDFGLVKSVAPAPEDQTQVTGHAMLVGTPLYMSPEQAQQNNLDIDTRSDVYALGVVLYELLTGSTPIERERFKKTAWNEAMRMIREVDPPTPSTRISSTDALPSVAALRQLEPARLSKLVRGELDWIVMKSLEKERNRRYESASALEKDIASYLQGDAVSASPPSKIYRLRKFARRNKVAIGTTVIVFGALTIGLGVAVYGLYQASYSANQERLAKTDAQEKQKDAEKQKLRAEAREKDAIDAVKKFADAVANNPELKNSPELDSLRKTLLKEPHAFFKSLMQRMEEEGRTQEESLVQMALIVFDTGVLSRAIGDQQDAAHSFEMAKRIWERLAREYPTVTEYQKDLATCQNNLGVLYRSMGQLAEAQIAYEAAMEIRERLTKAHPTVTEYQKDLAQFQNNLGIFFQETGKLAEALAAHEAAKEINERLVREHPSVPKYQCDLAQCRENLGRYFYSTGRTSEAVAELDSAKTIREQLVKDHPAELQYQSDLASSYGWHGAVLHRMRKSVEALAAHEAATAILQQLVRNNPTVTDYKASLAGSHMSCGQEFGRLDKLAEALGAYRASKDIYESLAKDHPSILAYQHALALCHACIGSCFYATSKHTEALAAFEAASEIASRLVRAVPTDANANYQSMLGDFLVFMARLEMESNHFHEAKSLILQAIEHQMQALTANSRNPSYSDLLEDHYRWLQLAAKGLQDSELEAAAVARAAEMGAIAPPILALDQRIEDVAAGAPAKDVEELFRIAERAYITKRFFHAVRFLSDALTRDAAQAESRATQRAHYAACCAALAASGQGSDAPKAEEHELRAKLRTQAHVWLSQELSRWEKFLDNASPEGRLFTLHMLQDWPKDPDLDSLRGDEIEKLPEAERESWRKLWNQVEELKHKAAAAIKDAAQPAEPPTLKPPEQEASAKDAAPAMVP
jgi:serine/threonine protein kinase/tetratricopeptide (TPR) repeat protein